LSLKQVVRPSTADKPWDSSKDGNGSTTNLTSIATIYGIVSFGPKRCGKEGVPGVYTRVTKYIPWILSTMEGRVKSNLNDMNQTLGEMDKMSIDLIEKLNETMIHSISNLDLIVSNLDKKLDQINNTFNIKLRELEDTLTNHTPVAVFAQDCYDIYKKHLLPPGIYNLESFGRPVKCLKDGWTSIQHRGQYGNPEDYFARNWTDYVQGFGSPENEHWIGLENIFKLTNCPSAPMKLRITMEDFSGEVREAYYSSFRIEDGSDKYRLRINGYSGTAGDAITGGHSLNNMKFSTQDQDNDKHSSVNCAAYFGGGGWWYGNCSPYSNLNGLNHDDGIADSRYTGISWRSSEWSTNEKRSLKTTTMAIRPNI